MKEIRLLHKQVPEILQIIKEMEQFGLVKGKDFDFAYHQPKYDSDGWEAVSPRQTVFTFYTEQHATLFVLKWLN